LIFKAKGLTIKAIIAPKIMRVIIGIKMPKDNKVKRTRRISKGVTDDIFISGIIILPHIY
jgi:hypothetical protein